MAQTHHTAGARKKTRTISPNRDFLSWLAIALLCAIVGLAGPANGNAAPRQPNIVFIFADDLGYGDLGCYGSRAIKTPNLDRMAAEGLRLTSFYVVAPVCTPSRAGLMTGRYPARMGAAQMHLSNVLFPTDKTGLPQTETTVARALKDRGYATACVGKWHLGHLPPHRPNDHGFDYYFGIPYSNDMKPTPLMRNAETVEEPARQDTLTRRYTEEAVGFIERSRDHPFFLYLAHNMPHIPLAASERFRGKSAGGLYGDAVAEVDWSVGQVLAALQRLGLDRDTLVFFSSDNGPWYQGSPGPLRGRKGWTYEGGIRVPGIARWPGHIPAASLSDEPVSTIDFFPTAIALAGEKEIGSASKQPLDGKNILPLLQGQQKKSPDDLLLFFDDVYLQAARAGRWKIHVARWNIPRYTAASDKKKNVRLAKPEPYDMTLDAAESYDLAAEHPDIVKDLEARIATALRTFPEEIQRANTAPDTSAADKMALAEKIDVSGTWIFHVESPMGSGSPTFVFKQDGDKLTGRYKGMFGEAPVTGTVKGKQIQFSFRVTVQGQEGTITYTGAIEKDIMKGTAQFDDLGSATWTAKRR